MLVNVFVPHVLAALLFRAYTPGVVTAVVINLPVMSVLAVAAVREKWVVGRKAAVFALIVRLVIAGMIPVLFMIGKIIL